MPCFVPFNKSFDLSFFALRPTGSFTEELVSQMKYFSFHAEDLGCAYSSVFQSIHGNLIIWYGAWIKRSQENREILRATLLSALAGVSDLAVLLRHGFFDPYAGESNDGRPTARIASGDTVFLGAMVPVASDMSDLSYACLALLKSNFKKMDGVSSAVCLECRDQPTVSVLYVWKSLEACYSWLFTSDYQNTLRPYHSHLSKETHFDIFKVVYVNRDDVPSIHFFPSRIMGRGGTRNDEQEE